MTHWVWVGVGVGVVNRWDGITGVQHAGTSTLFLPLFRVFLCSDLLALGAWDMHGVQGTEGDKC